MPQVKLGPFLFAVVCLALAVVHEFYHKLDATFIGLIMVAAIPWFVPWLIPMVSSLKVGSLELNFRELKQQVEENKQMMAATAAALTTGVGRSPAATMASAPATKAATAAAGDEPVAFSPMMPTLEAADDPGSGGSDDPNKGRFGGKPERDGLRLNAEVRAMPSSSEFCLVHVWVEAAGRRRPLADGTEVTFHLHPTFAQQVVKASASKGVASIDRMAWGAFTIGAEVDGTKLELDLATDVPDAPVEFRGR